MILVDTTVLIDTFKGVVNGKAANIYFTLRRQGITPRSTIDILIALTAIEYNLLLLHNDKDFDAMEEKVPELNIYK